MNKPDEQTLNRWLLGELEGEELRQVEAWANDHAGDLDSEFKCGIGWEALGADFMKQIPASEEPPYPEFFNHKLQQAIEDLPDPESWSEKTYACTILVEKKQKLLEFTRKRINRGEESPYRWVYQGRVLIRKRDS